MRAREAASRRAEVTPPPTPSELALVDPPLHPLARLGPGLGNARGCGRERHVLLLSAVPPLSASRLLSSRSSPLHVAHTAPTPWAPTTSALPPATPKPRRTVGAGERSWTRRRPATFAKPPTRCCSAATTGRSCAAGE